MSVVIELAFRIMPNIRNCRVKVQLAYDSNFKKNFGSKVSKHLGAIAAHAKTFYEHKSLDTNVNFVVVGNYIDAGYVSEDQNDCGLE